MILRSERLDSDTEVFKNNGCGVGSLNPSGAFSQAQNTTLNPNTLNPLTTLTSEPFLDWNMLWGSLGFRARVL